MTDQAKQKMIDCFEEFSLQFAEITENSRSTDVLIFKTGFDSGYSTAMSEAQGLIDALEKIASADKTGWSIVDGKESQWMARIFSDDTKLARQALKQFRQEIEPNG